MGFVNLISFAISCCHLLTSGTCGQCVTLRHHSSLLWFVSRGTDGPHLLPTTKSLRKFGHFSLQQSGGSKSDCSMFLNETEVKVNLLDRLVRQGRQTGCSNHIYILWRVCFDNYSRVRKKKGPQRSLCIASLWGFRHTPVELHSCRTSISFSLIICGHDTRNNKQASRFSSSCLSTRGLYHLALPCSISHTHTHTEK